MNQLQAKIMSAELGGEIPSLDLHGKFVDDALENLEIFLSDLIVSKEDVGKIIYGGGTGKLEEVVLYYLQNSKLIGKIIEKSGYSIIILK